MDNKYNGWTNYATWRVQLELVDDYVQSLLEDWAEYEDYNNQQWRELIEEYVDECLTNFGENDSGIALDYARSFVSDVNWYELADHAMEAMKEAKAV